jgi:hypothetical protein
MISCLDDSLDQSAEPALTDGPATRKTAAVRICARKWFSAPALSNPEWMTTTIAGPLMQR